MKKIFTLLLLTLSFSTWAAPKAELWSYWDKSNEQATDTISHDDWQLLLNKYLITKNQHTLFRYSDVSKKDKIKLESYINTLASLKPQDYSKKEQYSYWVNFYNALTVNLILDNYPTKSITKLGGFFSFGPWGKAIITVNDKKLTLNDIEHRILRPIWNDPRTHYALNCASLGCPNLQPSVFTATTSETLLEKAADEFINSDKGAELSEGRLQLSSIYDWFSDDFGSKEELFIHLAQYRPELSQFRGKVSYDYDWALNGK
ncbi:DUF547 domain-containing protein [Vibrio kyushuensis]|uniref:DUF547 domain-containing protein n=1 Tax=Vibrio kyushuensis TaxID=2910249 RepID=UPI003D0D4E68